MGLQAFESLLILAVLVGGGLWLFQLLPIDGRIKQVFTGIVLIVAIVWAIRWLFANVH